MSEGVGSCVIDGVRGGVRGGLSRVESLLLLDSSSRPSLTIC